MNDRMFDQALSIALILDQKGFLMRNVDTVDSKNYQNPGRKPCSKQIKAVLIIYELLLYPDITGVDDFKQELPPIRRIK